MTLEAGVPPERIAYLAFTKKAANEAIYRAEKKFGLTSRQLPYFRTLHSLCFRQLGLTRSQVMQKEHYTEFANLVGIDLTGFFDLSEGTSYGQAKGDRLLFIENLARARCLDIRQQYDEDDDDLDFHELDMIHRALRQYKASRGLYDYTDMLSVFLHRGYTPKIEVLLLDEAQDLSQLQWRVAAKLGKPAREVVYAGDDDQAIFGWAGADVNHFVELPGAQRVLGQSYRVPARVQTLADSVIRRVSHRRNKTWRARPEPGTVLYHNSWEHVDFSSGQFLVLARNSYSLQGVKDHLEYEGFVYSQHGRSSVKQETIDAIRAWERLRAGGRISGKAARGCYRLLETGRGYRVPFRGLPDVADFSMDELKKHYGLLTDAIWHQAFTRVPQDERLYYVAALRRGESLTKEPRIVLSTIHGAKGGQADNVVLLTDMAPRTYKEMERYPDDEARVYYVGITRTRETLHIIAPQSSRGFSL